MELVIVVLIDRFDSVPADRRCSSCRGDSRVVTLNGDTSRSDLKAEGEEGDLEVNALTDDDAHLLFDLRSRGSKLIVKDIDPGR